MSVPGGPVFIAGTGCPDAVGMMGSVASPVVRHRQQTLDLMTGVRQGLQKVHPSHLLKRQGQDRQDWRVTATSNPSVFSHRTGWPASTHSESRSGSCLRTQERATGG